MFLDSHCHLTYGPLAADFAGVVERALAAEVTAAINIGDTLESSAAACQQAENSGALEMWATVGVHPQRAAEYDFRTNGDALRRLAAHPKVCALGEMGLDFLYDETHPQY